MLNPPMGKHAVMKEVSSPDKVLGGVRVLDFTDRLVVLYCTRYLAD
jgi:hypothetical protein